MAKDWRAFLKTIMGGNRDEFTTLDRTFIDRCSTLSIDPRWCPTSRGIDRLELIAAGVGYIG